MRHGPAAAVDGDADAGREDAGEVFVEATAGYMCDAVDHAFHFIVAEHVPDRAGVDRGRPQQDLADGRITWLANVVDFELRQVEDDFADEAIAVRVQAARGDAEHDMACRDRRAIENIGPLDHTDAETGEVIVTALIKVGHDCRLAADERHVARQAAVADASDDRFQQGRVVVRHRHVVEEEQRLCPPQQRQSLTHIAIRSMPTLLWMPASWATSSFVPTPSVPETSTGSL